MTTKRSSDLNRLNAYEPDLETPHHGGRAADTDTSLEDITPEQLAELAVSKGLELRKKRSKPKVISQKSTTRGKTAINISLPTELRIAMQNAKTITNQSMSCMIEEAMVDWFHKHEIRLPKFETTWDK